MSNIPDSIQTIVDQITIDVTPGVLTQSTIYTDITVLKADDPGWAVGMYLEFEGFSERRQILTITESSNDLVLRVDRYAAVEVGTPEVRILLNYFYGNPKEIQARIIEMSTNNDQKRRKYPLLALFLDSPETIGANGFTFESSINMAIIIDAPLDWNPDSRLTYSFKQKLYPIYELFISLCEVEFSPNEWNKIEHIKTDKYYYSSTPVKDQNTIAQAVDAIEINNFELKVRECN